MLLKTAFPFNRPRYGARRSIGNMLHGKEGPFPYRGSPSPHLPSGRPIRRRREEKSTVSPFALQGIGDRQRRGDRTSAAACAAGGRAVPGRAQSIGDRFIPAAARRRPKIYRPIRRQAQSLYAFRRDGAACGRYGVASAGKGRPPLSRRFFAGGCGTSSPCRQDDKRSNAAGGIGNFGISKDGVLTNAIAFFFSTG